LEEKSQGGGRRAEGAACVRVMKRSRLATQKAGLSEKKPGGGGTKLVVERGREVGIEPLRAN